MGPTEGLLGDFKIQKEVYNKSKKPPVHGWCISSYRWINSSSFALEENEGGKRDRSIVESLQRQFQRHEQEKMEMREELTETRRQVTALMEHLGFAASSSRPPPSPQNYNDENEDDGDDFSDHLE